MASYVTITREELEHWLGALPQPWSRKPNTAGIYLIHMSDVVAVRLSSTLSVSEGNITKDYAQASMQLALVSRITGQVLNKKAQGQSHFKRTTNWRTTWKDGIERMRDAYMKAQGFYDALAAIKDREAYKNDTLDKIEAVQGWQTHDLLADLHKRVAQDGILTQKQLAFVEDMARKKAPPPPAPSKPAPASRDEDLYQRLRTLYTEANRHGDQWLKEFLTSVGPRVRDGLALSPKQQDVIQRNLEKYRL